MQKTTGTRVTVRLTADDERAISTLTAHMRPRFALVNKSDIVRAALQEAQRVLTTDQAGRCDPGTILGAGEVLPP